jgi:hypothetical protein
MIRVTVELVPFGDESRKRKIGEMIVANDLTGNIDYGCYRAYISSDNWTKEPERFTKVNGFDRTKSVWSLISRVIKNLGNFDIENEKDQQFFDKFSKKEKK